MNLFVSSPSRRSFLTDSVARTAGAPRTATPGSRIRLLPIACLLAAWTSLSVSSVLADAGGGTSGGANVSVSVSSGKATLSNGIIKATVEIGRARVTSYTFNNTQMIDTAEHAYWSLDGGDTYEGPQNCVYRATVNTTDMVDISCKQTWRSGGPYKHAMDIDVHFVLRRGDTGMYSYVILNHPSNYPALSFGEWRMVWRLPHDSNNFYFERAYVDNLRNWKTPTFYDYAHDAAADISEVTKLTTGGWKGQYSCKYMYNAEYFAINCWGQASDTNKRGAWFVLGGKDYFNDGPTHTDLTLGEGYMLIHFGRDHFGGSNTSVKSGEGWRKMFGPFLMYCNNSSASSGAGNAMWANAKAQATTESNAQPYSWLTYQSTDYPVASQRGKVTGKLVVVDKVRTRANASNGWVGLARPGSGGNWQLESKYYQYWAKTDSSGNFTIPNVRPATYMLYAFTNGANGSVGEYSRGSIVVAAGKTLALGNVTWNVPHGGTKLVWEIGVPDRSAAEFKHGSTDYFKPYKWLSFRSEFSNPLNYNIGSSTPANNWNYAHTPYPNSSGDASGSWKWNINFNLSSVPASGNARLTIAFAGSTAAHLFVSVNSTSTLDDFYPPNGGGNGLLREGIHTKYGVTYVSIPVSRLKVGANTISLVQASAGAMGNHAMYDYLNLEMP